MARKIRLPKNTRRVLHLYAAVMDLKPDKFVNQIIKTSLQQVIEAANFRGRIVQELCGDNKPTVKGLKIQKGAAHFKTWEGALKALAEKPKRKKTA